MSEQEIRQRVEQFYSGRAEFFIHFLVFVLVNAGLWAVWALSQGTISFAWPMIVTLGWGSGLVSHAIEWLAKDPRRLAGLNRAAEKRMVQLYGPDWEVLSDEDDLQRIRAATWRQFNHNKELAIHGAVYVCINLMAWLLWAAAQGTMSLLFPLALLLLWGAGLGAHAVTNFFDSSRAVVARERAVQQAISRYNEDYDAPPEKRKRAKIKHVLTDDGEILDIVEDDASEQERQSWRRIGSSQEPSPSRVRRARASPLAAPSSDGAGRWAMEPAANPPTSRANASCRSSRNARIGFGSGTVLT